MHNKMINMASKFTKKSVDTWNNAWKEGKLSNSLGAITSGVTGIADSFVSNNQIKDTAEEEALINAVENTYFGSGSYDNLLASFNTMNMSRSNYDMEDVRGVTGMQGVGNTLKGAASGAVSGAQIGGPWGAVVGGVLGLGTGIAGWFNGNRKAREKAEELNREAEQANNQYLANFENAASNTHNTMFNNTLLNMAARGGKIYIKPQNRGKFTEYCGGKVTAECIARGKRSSSSTIRKRATFAANARKWHHSLGGNLFDDGGLMFQHGGIFSNGITTINNGGTHEQNPFEGVQMGVDNQGIPNMVEEGEVVWQDYVFSNRLKPTKEFKDKYKLKGETFADIAKEMQKESEERPNDPISRSGLEDSMTKLMIEQEGIRQKGNKQNSNKFADGSWLRYAPVVGSVLGVASDLIGTTNKPDYSNINLIQDATNRITPVGYTPIGTYLSYNPFDKNYYSNKLSEQAGATRRAITNQAINPGAAMAGLLTADYNAQTQLGGLFRQAEEYNQAQRERVAGFNRQTDAMNAEMAMKAAIADKQSDELRLKSAITQAQMREQADAPAGAARSANLSGLFTNLGNVGTDILNRADRDMLIKSGVFGTLSQKPTDWSDDKWKLYQEALNMTACGGKINRKKVKRGLTY